jgi:hypothetical protein
MNLWKVTNISPEPVKVGIITSNTSSMGVILKKEEFVIALPQITAALDAQSRRGFVKIEEGFTNELNLNIGEVYSTETYNQKLAEAIKNANDYIKKD